MPTRIIESGTAGPAYSAATCPVITKIPAPMTAPMPRVTRLRGPSAGTRACSPVASASARSAAIGLVANKVMQQCEGPAFTVTAMWDGRDSGRYERDLGFEGREADRWTQGLDRQQQRLDLLPVKRACFRDRGDEDVGLNQDVRSPRDIRGRDEERQLGAGRREGRHRRIAGRVEQTR